MTETNTRVMAHFTPWQVENAKKRIVGAFEFLMDDEHNYTSKEQATELVAQFKAMMFEKLNVQEQTPDIYQQSHFYALFQDHEQTHNYEFVLRIRKYEYRDGYECHLSIQYIETKEDALHFEKHKFDLPINF